MCMCSRCKTGAELLQLDCRNPVCLYVNCIVEDECPFFAPIEKDDELKKITKRYLQEEKLVV